MEVKEKESPALIESLVVDENNETSEENQPLIPELEAGSNEPDYENMDTLALLSSLNLQEHKPAEDNDCLLPNLN